MITPSEMSYFCFAKVEQTLQYLLQVLHTNIPFPLIGTMGMSEHFVN